MMIHQTESENPLWKYQQPIVLLFRSRRRRTDVVCTKTRLTRKLFVTHNVCSRPNFEWKWYSAIMLTGNREAIRPPGYSRQTYKDTLMLPLRPFFKDKISSSKNLQKLPHQFPAVRNGSFCKFLDELILYVLKKNGLYYTLSHFLLIINICREDCIYQLFISVPLGR